MNEILSDERKVLSSYRDVARTFTYGIYATLPLFIVYQVVTYFIGVTVTKDGQTHPIMNGADYFLGQISMWLGIPEKGMPLLLIAAMIAMFYHERKHFGFIQSRLSFFFRTLSESVYFGLILGYTAALLTATVIFFYSGTFPPIIPESTPVPFINALQKTGSGFYEEILYRVIFLGGLLAILKTLRVPGMPARIVAVTVTTTFFASRHFMGPFAYPYDMESFLYLSYLGVFFSAIYLWRGFATAAWSHALFDIFLSF
jgi:hypothetical protein